MQNKVEEMMRHRASRGKVVFEVGIGINTGVAVAGNLGSPQRMDYTVIGDSVNIAESLQKIACGGEIIIGEQTFLETKGGFTVEEKGTVKLKKKEKPVLCYSVLR